MQRRDFMTRAVAAACGYGLAAVLPNGIPRADASGDEKPFRVPAWRRGISPGRIVQVGTNRLADLDPAKNPAINPNYPNAPEWAGSDGQAGIVLPWCGGCWDNGGATLWLPLQGGHGNYAGNEGYRLRLLDDAPAWVMTRPPSGAVGNLLKTRDGKEATGNYADGRPRAIHSFNKPVYVPGIGPVMTVQGNTSWTASAGTARTLLLDEVTGEWAEKTIHPAPGATVSGGACYDSKRHGIWYKSSAEGPTSFLDLATWRWTVFRRWQNERSWQAKRLVYLPEHDLVFQADGEKPNKFCLLDPTTGFIHTPPVEGNIPDGLVFNGGSGCDWDGMRLLVWHFASRTNFIGTFTPGSDPLKDAWRWGELEFSGITPSPAIRWGTYGRFAFSRHLRGCVLQNAVGTRTYFFSIG